MKALAQSDYLAHEAALVTAFRRLGRLLHEESADDLAWLGFKRICSVAQECGTTAFHLEKALNAEPDWATRCIEEGRLLAALEAGADVSLGDLTPAAVEAIKAGEKL